MPPNSSRASPISLALSPARRDMTEYALPTTVSWAEKVDTNGPLTTLLNDHVAEEPGGATPVVRAESKVRERRLEQHQGIERNLRCVGERLGASRRESAAQAVSHDVEAKTRVAGAQRSHGFGDARGADRSRSFLHHVPRRQVQELPDAAGDAAGHVSRSRGCHQPAALNLARISEPGRWRICGSPSVASSLEVSTKRQHELDEFVLCLRIRSRARAGVRSLYPGSCAARATRRPP